MLDHDLARVVPSRDKCNEGQVTVYLKPFCDYVDSRYLLQNPFVLDGHRYACDGRIAVRFPTNEANSEPPPGKRLPGVKGIGWGHSTVNQLLWQPWPEPVYLRLGKLRDVDGDPLCDFRRLDESDARIKLETPGRNYLYVAIVYDVLIRAFLPFPEFIVEPNLGRALIRFHGGEAILMGLKVDEDEEEQL